MGQWELGGITCRVLVHMMAARLGYKRAMIGTRWANSRYGCVNRLRKHYFHLVGSREGCFASQWAIAN